MPFVTLTAKVSFKIAVDVDCPLVERWVGLTLF
jgi:hypothetical protein